MNFILYSPYFMLSLPAPDGPFQYLVSLPLLTGARRMVPVRPDCETIGNL